MISLPREQIQLMLEPGFESPPPDSKASVVNHALRIPKPSKKKVHIQKDKIRQVWGSCLTSPCLLRSHFFIQDNSTWLYVWPDSRVHMMEGILSFCCFCVVDFIQSGFHSPVHKGRRCGVPFAHEDTEARRYRVIFLQKLGSANCPCCFRRPRPSHHSRPCSGALCCSAGELPGPLLRLFFSPRFHPLISDAWLRPCHSESNLQDLQSHYTGMINRKELLLMLF